MIYNSERTLNALAVMGDQKPNTELRDVEITLGGALGGSVKVDGCENQYVSRVSLDYKLGELPAVTVYHLAHKTIVKGRAMVSEISTCPKCESHSQA